MSDRRDLPIIVAFVAGCAGLGFLSNFVVKAFDVPDDYARQGYHQCDFTFWVVRE